MSRLEELFKPEAPPYRYKDRKFQGTDEEYAECLKKSTTLYVGDVNPIVEEEYLWELFGICGKVKRIIMGINRNDLRPCGFCFVEYYDRKDAEEAVKFYNGLLYEGRHLKCDIDHGFEDGRQFGRGERGGQVRDDFKRKKLF